MIESIWSQAQRVPGRSFFLILALLVSVIVVYGFSFTIRENLLHPPYPRPLILYVHAAVFSAWVLLFIAQTTLVQVRRIDLHRRLGLLGLALGAAIPVIGIATAMAMTRLRVAHGELDAARGVLIPCFDMIAFTSTFILGAVWRRRPELHRRCMWVATATLTAAAFGRMPLLDHAEWFYAGVDALILLGALRDLVVYHRIHPVYWYSFPAIVAGQLLTAYVRWSPWWVDLAPGLFR